MGEGNNAAINPPEHPKDAMAREWERQNNEAGNTPEEVVAKLIESGAKIISYVGGVWNPALGGGERKMFYPGGSKYGGRWGAKTIECGLQFLVEIDGSRDLGADCLCMVPYPGFGEDGSLIPSDSKILLFTKKQVQQLKELLGLR